MTQLNTKKIVNKFIPKTNSRSKKRILQIVKYIQLQEKKNKAKKEKKRTGIKSYKRRYYKNIGGMQNIETVQSTKRISDLNHIEPNQIETRVPIHPTQTQKKSQDHLKHIKIRKHSSHKTNKINKTNTSNTYIIAIPSYNRPELIQVKTLSLLHKHNINPKAINIFVSDKDQYDLYKEKVPKKLYNKLIIGVKGLKNQRNYINNYYPEGNHIVEMDDDIDKIVQLVIKRKTQKKNTAVQKSIKTSKPITNLDKFIKDAFKKCMLNGIFLWGVYPLANPYFMTDTVTTDLRFIVGPFWGMINRHRKDLQLTINEKENSERTLQNWVIDGSVLRFNNIGIETKYYKNKGGMQNNSTDPNYRKEEALKSAHYLHNKYPTLTKLNLSKKSGIPEIKLLRK